MFESMKFYILLLLSDKVNFIKNIYHIVIISGVGVISLYGNLTLSMPGRNFSRLHFETFFLIFPRKTAFDISYKLFSESRI